MLLPFLLCSLLFSSCVKPYLPETDQYDTLLVVDGILTDKPGPYTIKLSKSTKIIEFSPLQPYKNCNVKISDNLGNSEILRETSEGVYQTDLLNGIQTVAGRKYKLTVITPEGNIYESEEEKLNKGISIDSIHAQIESQPGDKFGYQFYLDFGPLTNDQYLLWQLEKTYKYTADFASISSMYLTCFTTKPILGINLYNNSQYMQSQPKKVPLYYEDNYSKALTIRYSLKIDQYTIDKEAYDYWKQIKKIMAEQGEIYSHQPYQVKSNIQSITNPNTFALGYFMVAGLDEKRIFLNRPSIPFLYPVCVHNPPSEDPVQCLDCREDEGGNGFLQKPSFWID
ncbi:MAG TPA: DUF4249 domain-containing protein [Bacteroidia bacterium]|nr:DUF4249 domain-containing protein [Bacteroidia bacterium]